jgi:hypothetical protein
MAGRASGALRRAVYREVTDEAGRNLKFCVRRIDDADKVPSGQTLHNHRWSSPV